VTILIQANNLVDIMDIEDTTLKNQQILDEVQPLARRIMDSFMIIQLRMGLILCGYRSNNY
jgi:hypothetical protein